MLINVSSVLLVYFRTSQNSSLDGVALQFGLMTLTYVGVFLGAVTSSHRQESSKRQRSDQQLRYDATHDSLTGLYNRAWLVNRLQRSVEQKHSNPDYRFAVLFLDLDSFKNVNDSLGHIVGDRLLTQIARRLTSCPPANKMLVRLGGDEFVVFLEEIIDIAHVKIIAQKIIEKLSQIYTIDTHEIYTSTSIGITTSQFNYEKPEDILRDADIALYQAKARGKRQYAMFSLSMYQRVKRRSQLETDLRYAVEQLAIR